jgi:hypothetical protein
LAEGRRYSPDFAEVGRVARQGFGNLSDKRVLDQVSDYRTPSTPVGLGQSSGCRFRRATGHGPKMLTDNKMAMVRRSTDVACPPHCPAARPAGGEYSFGPGGGGNIMALVGTLFDPRHPADGKPSTAINNAPELIPGRRSLEMEILANQMEFHRLYNRPCLKTTQIDSARKRVAIENDFVVPFLLHAIDKGPHSLTNGIVDCHQNM